MRVSLFFLILIVCPLLIFTGCKTVNERFSGYVPEPSLLNKPLIDGLLVEKVINAQPQEENLPFNPNEDPWILIPFCFYSAQKVDPLVKRNFFQSNLDEALQRLFIKDLRASHISRTISCTDTTNLNRDFWKNKYRLQIILKHAVWNRNITAYGISYVGTILWSLGLPVSYGDVQLEIEAQLFPPGEAKKPIATTVLKGNRSCVELIYDQVGYRSSVSEDKLTEIFPEIARDLRKFMIKNLKKAKK